APLKTRAPRCVTELGFRGDEPGLTASRPVELVEGRLNSATLHVGGRRVVRGLSLSTDVATLAVAPQYELRIVGVALRYEGYGKHFHHTYALRFLHLNELSGRFATSTWEPPTRWEPLPFVDAFW